MTYVKDRSGIVINTDDTYLKSLRSMRETRQRMDSMQNSINEFKDELSEIKSLLLKVLNG